MAKYYKKIKKEYKPGEMVFSENSPCDGMYIVEKGKVRVFKTLETPAGSQELELIQLGPNSMFGEMALIDDKPRSASVQAINDVECMVITAQMFEDQLSQLPGWVVNLIRVLVSRLRETNDKLREKAKNYHDDTGGLLVVDESQQSRAKEIKVKLEGTIGRAEEKLKNITESLDGVKQRDMKEITGLAAGGFPVGDDESDGKDSTELSLERIPKKSIDEIRKGVDRIDRQMRKK